MRLIKILSFAAAAAVAVTAILRPSPAMAEFDTALCGELSGVLACPEESLIEEFAMLAKTTVLSTSVATVLCLHSAATATVETEGLLAKAPEPLRINVTSLTWGECGTNKEHNNCTVITEKLPLLDVLKEAEDLGTATALDLEVHVQCPEEIDCYYGGSAVKGFAIESAEHTEGAGNGMFIANELSVPKVKGFLCPAESYWTALYEPLEPEIQTQLCWAHETPCASENQVESFTVLATKEALKTSVATVLCLHAKASAKPEESAGAPLRVEVTELTWNECGTNEEHNNCTVTNEKLPLLDLWWAVEGLGTATALSFEIHVTCPLINCYYGGTASGFTVESAEHTESAGNGMFTASEMSVPKVKGFLCPAKSYWTALYEPLKPLYLSPVFIGKGVPLWIRS